MFLIYLVFLVLFAYQQLIWAFVLLVVLYNAVSFIVNKFMWRKNIGRILYEDLDGKLYREVVVAGGVDTQSPLVGMQSLFYAGDVEGALRLGEDLLKVESFAKNNARLTLLLLAESYFIIGDDAALASACKRFREVKRQKCFSKEAKRRLACIENYEMYLAGDYESLIRKTGKGRKDALYKLSMSYREARIALSRGDKEKARALLSEISATADKNVLGMMSKSIVDALDKGSDHCEPFPVLPNGPINAEMMVDIYSASVKKSRSLFIIALIFIALGLLFYYYGVIFG